MFNTIEVKLSQSQLDALQQSIDSSLKTIVDQTVTPFNQSRYINKVQACKYANISYNTLQRWLNDGLPYYHINNVVRISLKELDYWIKLHRQNQGVTNDTLDYNKSVV